MRNIRILLVSALFLTGTVSARTLSISVREGEQWTSTHKLGLIKLKIIPQMAFWLEDTSGNFVKTLYVTENSGTQKWRTTPGEKKEDIRRPSALPVWSHARGIQAEDGLYMPTMNNPVADAVTGATPKASFTRKIDIPDSIPDGTYCVYAEINSSFDYNQTYSEETDPDFSGQPSLIWKAMIELGGDDNEAKLEIAGHGHPRGETGEIYSDLSGFTTALEIVKTITVSSISIRP